MRWQSHREPFEFKDEDTSLTLKGLYNYNPPTTDYLVGGQWIPGDPSVLEFEITDIELGGIEFTAKNKTLHREDVPANLSEQIVDHIELQEMNFEEEGE